MTDARHDSTSNAYHTTVPCLVGRYEYVYYIIIFTLKLSSCRIVGINTTSRAEHGVAQTREIVCTKAVMTDVVARGMLCSTGCVVFNNYNAGLNVAEVAHDCQPQVTRFVIDELHATNTWHGKLSVCSN